MGRLAQATLQRKKYEEEQKQNQEQPQPTSRPLANRIYDALNPVDSGRSFTTDTPSKEQSKKSAKTQLRDTKNSVVGSLTSAYKRLGEGGGEVLDEITGGADKAQEEYSKAQDDQQKLLTDARKKAKTETDPAKKARYEKAADKIQANMDESFKNRTGRLDEKVERTDPVKAAAAVGEVGLDILTAGTGSAAMQSGKLASKQATKEVVKQGGRMAANRIATAAAKTGGQGAIGGALSAVEQNGKDVTLEQAATGALAGTAMGAGFGGAAAGLGEIAGKARPLGNKGSVKNPFYHTTTADKVDSILSDGKLKINQQLDDTGKPVVSDEFDSQPGVFLGTKDDNMWNKSASENVRFAYDEDTLNKYSTVKRESDNSQAVALGDIPTTPETVSSVKVGTEVTAQKFRDRGFKNVIVDETLDERPVEKKNITMASEVEPPTTETLVAEVPRREKTLTEISDSANKRPDAEIQKAIEEAHNAGDTATVESLIPQLSPDMQMGMRSALGLPEPAPKVQLKVLDDVQREADVRSPGDVNTPAKQVTETRTQQGAQYISDDIERLNQEIGAELTPLDRKVAGLLTGDNSSAKITRGWKAQVGDWLGKNFQDTLTYAAKTVGRPGVELVQDMLAGNKFKRDALEAMRDNMIGLAKLNKKLTPIQKRDLGARIGAALDDRANAQTYLRTDAERQMYDHYLTIFDFVKTQREKAGLEVLENYRPWVNMKDAAEPPAWLAQGLTDKSVRTLSRFSKERVKTEVGDDVDNNLADMIYGYVNSQLNEMAYDAPVRKFKTNFNTIAAGNKANEGSLTAGVDYLSDLVKQAVHPSSKDLPERIINKLTSNVYGSVLPFNPKLTVMNKTQQWAANSFVSKGAVRLSKKLSNELKEFENGLVFGDQSVFGQLEDVNAVPTGKTRGLREKVAKIDPYQRGERANVITSYNKGVVQAAMDSDIYKNAVKGGMKKHEAVLEALKDEGVQKTAKLRGNLIVNDTQFGASPLARPGALRSEASVLGIPMKSLTMFARFPIGMSQHILEAFNAKNARAVELMKSGDPRFMAVSEMHTNYKAFAEVLKEAQQTVKAGTDIGVPEDVLRAQLKTVNKNLAIIDKQSKKLSQMRSGKTLKNVAKMWAAAAAIQVIFDGGIQSFADDPATTGGEALTKTNPSAVGMIYGQNSKLAGLSSAASPVDRYGGLNERALTNYIPGVGLAVNRGRDIKKLAESLMGSPEEQ